MAQSFFKQLIFVSLYVMRLLVRADTVLRRDTLAANWPVIQPDEA
jgi:hypothetical protein